MTLPDITAGTTPTHDTETVFLSALVQATAGRIIDLAPHLEEQDFTPAGWIIFTAVIDHAQHVAQTAPSTVLNLPVIHASLSAQGAFNGHDTGTRALLNEIATTPADPIWAPHLINGLKVETWRKALATFQKTVADLDPETIGVSDAGHQLNNATSALQQAHHRIHPTTSTSKAGTHLETV